MDNPNNQNPVIDPTQPVADPNAIMPGAPAAPAESNGIPGTPAPVEPTPTVPSETPVEPGMPTPAAGEMPGVTPPTPPTGEPTTGV